MREHGSESLVQHLALGGGCSIQLSHEVTDSLVLILDQGRKTLISKMRA